jgi:hypothetical protein
LGPPPPPPPPARGAARPPGPPPPAKLNARAFAQLLEENGLRQKRVRRAPCCLHCGHPVAIERPKSVHLLRNGSGGWLCDDRCALALLQSPIETPCLNPAVPSARPAAGDADDPDPDRVPGSPPAAIPPSAIPTLESRVFAPSGHIEQTAESESYASAPHLHGPETPDTASPAIPPQDHVGEAAVPPHAPGDTESHPVAPQPCLASTPSNLTPEGCTSELPLHAPRRSESAKADFARTDRYFQCRDSNRRAVGHAESQIDVSGDSTDTLRDTVSQNDASPRPLTGGQPPAATPEGESAKTCRPPPRATLRPEP